MKLPFIKPFKIDRKTPMKPYALNRLNQFNKEAREDIIQLNGLIKKYNENSSVKLLKEIFNAQQSMRNKYPPQLIAQCPTYELIYQELIENLILAFHEHGINSLPNVFAPTAQPLDPNRVPPPLASLLANMPPSKINLLVQIIITNAQNDLPWNSVLSPVFTQDEEGYEEFNNFLSSHELKLVNRGNSINLHIINKNGKDYLLRIEIDRETAPKLEIDLRNTSLSTTLTSVFLERTGSAVMSGRQVSVVLWLGEWCEQGNILEDSRRHQTDEARAQSAIDIFWQMSMVLQKVEEEGGMFVDMKNENWLLNRHRILRISDPKSLVYADPSSKEIALYDFEQHAGDYQNRWQGLILSRQMIPPEFQRKKENGAWVPPIEAGPAHAYMLGKNMYQYLTGCSNDDLRTNRSFETLNFSAPIFATMQGKALVEIIKDLFSSAPETRVTLQRTTQALERLQPLKQQDCQRMLKEINSVCSFGNNDTCMHEYLDMMQGAITIAARQNDDRTLDEIYSRLSQTLKTTTMVTREVQTLVRVLNNKSEAIFGGNKSNEKANKIILAMTKVPVLERANLIDGHSEETRTVLKLMAMRRSSEQTPCLSDGSIDEKRAARTFTDFKQRMCQVKEVQPYTVLHQSTSTGL